MDRQGIIDACDHAFQGQKPVSDILLSDALAAYFEKVGPAANAGDIAAIINDQILYTLNRMITDVLLEALAD